MGSDLEGRLSLGERIGALRRSIEQTARQCGRDPGQIRFILVTKTVAPLKVRQAFEAGVSDFGENRVQELLEKKKQLPRSNSTETNVFTQK